MTGRECIVVASGRAEVRDRWISQLTQKYNLSEACDEKSLHQIVVQLKPFFVIVDLTLPGLDHVDGVCAIRRASPASNVLVLTDRQTVDEAIAVLKTGAKGYCSAYTTGALLMKAVFAVQNGELWVDRKLLAALVGRFIACHPSPQMPAARHDERLERLTVRQREVANAIATGASNKEIAMRLNVTERTVKAHLTEMFRNLGVLDRMHLAVMMNRIAGGQFQPMNPIGNSPMRVRNDPVRVRSDGAVGPGHATASEYQRR